MTAALAFGTGNVILVDCVQRPKKGCGVPLGRCRIMAKVAHPCRNLNLKLADDGDPQSRMQYSADHFVVHCSGPSVGETCSALVCIHQFCLRQHQYTKDVRDQTILGLRHICGRPHRHLFIQCWNDRQDAHPRRHSGIFVYHQIIIKNDVSCGFFCIIFWAIMYLNANVNVLHRITNYGTVIGQPV